MQAAPAVPTQPTVLFSRHEHGGHPVHIHNQGYEVQWPDGPATYPSARALVRALYSGGDGSLCARDPGVSLQRYFRLGRKPIPSGLFGLLGMDVPVSAPTWPAVPKPTPVRVSTKLRRRARLTVEAPWWDRGVVVGGAKPLGAAAWWRKPTKLTVEIGGPVLGIDLVNRPHEVRKLLFAGFGGRIARAGYDPEDVLQEVYRGLLARNIGKCPWDIRKSSFGHYVHMVSECVLNNYARKQRRIAKFEQIGVGGLGADGEWGQKDAAEVASVTAGNSVLGIEEGVSRELALCSLSEAVAGSGRPETPLAVKALPWVAQGYQRGEIAAQLGEDASRVGRALALIRKVSAVWAVEQGLR